MTNIPFHRSSLTHICWDEYAVKLQELKSYQGSEALQERVFKQCKTFCEGKNFYFVNSGTAALELALMAMELNEQDEVILPSLTFSSCANAVLRAGGVPCFSDISLPNMHVKLENILPLVTERT
ncbi:MAG: aminotransferase class I/II-fold pyridoxal phosphate-dependent enzyme, partial [Hellea sp.]